MLQLTLGSATSEPPLSRRAAPDQVRRRLFARIELLTKLVLLRSRADMEEIQAQPKRLNLAGLAKRALIAFLYRLRSPGSIAIRAFVFAEQRENFSLAGAAHCYV